MLTLTNNRKAFLDTIAWSELGTALMAASDNGYNVLVGSTASHPLLFGSYADHPRVFNAKLNSTAAGRYQLLAKYFDPYKRLLGLEDFSPPAQDQIALQQIKECRALPLIDAGRFTQAALAVGRIWASFPGNSYGQHTNDISSLTNAYLDAGGDLGPLTA